MPKEEAQQVADILKKEGRTVDVHYYSNEGHGFVKREKPDRCYSSHARLVRPLPESANRRGRGRSAALGGDPNLAYGIFISQSAMLARNRFLAFPA